MKKYDLSKIMKDAWRNFRNRVASFSACLKDAWKNAKEAITMTKEEKLRDSSKLEQSAGKRTVWTDFI